MGISRPFSLLIKPVSASCNLRCKYCFYIDHLDYIKKGDEAKMSSATLETLISSYMSLPMQEYSFAWQGGEPTLAGLEFYQEAVALQNRYLSKGARVTNAIQTNATLINKPMARFFAENNFLIGVSLDGPKKYHDIFRVSSSGGKTHSMVLRGIQYLKEAGAEYNILILVNSENVKKPRELYKYFKDKGFNFLQFIPCVEYDANGKLLYYSITGKEWGNFLSEIFDLWYRKDSRKVSIRHFDSVLNYLVLGRYTVCTMDRDCRQYFVVEYDGGIFPCDFFVKKELQLGNVNSTTWEEAIVHPLYEDFGKRKMQLNKKCITCKWLPLCNGDCQKMRGPDSNPETLSTLCEGWRIFYDHTMERFEKLAAALK
ncbi:MAG: anaerobic sulfatase maturase [Spirochaetes bacterium]|nr:MAG: anaerobic sulfatase maturase [Spirochaetota bacterium]